MLPQLSMLRSCMPEALTIVRTIINGLIRPVILNEAGYVIL